MRDNLAIDNSCYIFSVLTTVDHMVIAPRH
jgi:hypothetical protein